MRFNKKKNVFYEVDISCTPLSTSKSELIRSQLGTTRASWLGIGTKQAYSIYCNVLKLRKKFKRKNIRLCCVTKCIVCKRKQFVQNVQTTSNWGPICLYTQGKGLFVVIHHFNKKHLLIFDTKECKEMYTTNPMGYDLHKMYGL